jgi:hypothetical protein
MPNHAEDKPVGRWWWLNPWRTAREYATSAHQLARMNVALGDGNDRLRRENASLADRMRRLSAPPLGEPEGQMTPEFVLVGVPRGRLGKRLMASKDLAGTALGMATVPEGVRWKIGAVMGNMLVIDKPTYGEGLARLAEIWANWQRNAEQEQARTTPRSIDPHQPVQVIADPRIPSGHIVMNAAHPELEKGDG